MDVYGLSAPDCFPIDDLLDFSNDELFSSSTAPAADSEIHPHIPSSGNSEAAGCHFISAPNPNHSTDFTDDLCVPNDDVAELEWLSNFVDDSFMDFQANEIAGIVNFRPETAFHGRSQSKRSRATSTSNGWTISPESEAPVAGKPKANTTGKKRENSAAAQQDVVRRCTHCASEKTPQWRTGPLGPKTLCNACGVRYKSGRLVPEYRPAASPTFVLTQHSNSHRKVMELRRQKELLQQQQQEQQLFHHHHRQKNFEVC